jgi:hypothetical protein
MAELEVLLNFTVSIHAILDEMEVRMNILHEELKASQEEMKAIQGEI